MTFLDADGELGGAPFSSFDEAAAAVLDVLRRRVGLRLWLVTRAAGEDQVVLQADGPDDAAFSAGTVLSWSGSLCRQMVAGHGPTIAPHVADVPAYARATNRQLMDIEAYAGVPLRLGDGTVFGSLCGFDPEPQSDALLAARPAIQLAGRLLATVLDLELGRQQVMRRAERAELDATRDELTGLSNRRGWNQVLAAEEARCRRYGHPACVLVLDVNGLKTVNDAHGHAAGDEVLRTCAQVLTTTSRDADLVARLGGDEFAVLAVETDAVGGRTTAAHLRAALADAGIRAAIGVAGRPAAGLDRRCVAPGRRGHVPGEGRPQLTTADHRKPPSPLDERHRPQAAMLFRMETYLVEAHATFPDGPDETFRTVQDRLEAHEDVLADPPAKVIPPDAEPHAIVQFAIEADGSVKADAKGQSVASEVLGAEEDGSVLAELGTVSARTIEGHASE